MPKLKYSLTIAAAALAVTGTADASARHHVHHRLSMHAAQQALTLSTIDMSEMLGGPGKNAPVYSTCKRTRVSRIQCKVKIVGYAQTMRLLAVIRTSGIWTEVWYEHVRVTDNR